MFAMLLYNVDPKMLCAQVVDTLKPRMLDLRTPT